MCFKNFFWEKVTNDYAAPVAVFALGFGLFFPAPLGTSRSSCGTAAGNSYLADQKVTYHQIGKMACVSLPCGPQYDHLTGKVTPSPSNNSIGANR